MKLTILGHEYNLEEENPGMWSGNAMGRSNVRTGEIRIAAQMPKTMRDSTLLHEILHQLSDLLDLPGVGENETVMSGLAIGILDFIRNNKAVVHGMMETGES